MKSERTFWGFIFIAGAVFLILSKLRLFQGFTLFSLILSILLVAVMLKGIVRKRFPEIFFPAAFLCIIYSDILGISRLTPWPILAAALLASIGCSLLFNKNNYCQETDTSRHSNSFPTDTEQIEGEHIMFRTSFGSSIKYINSDNFEYATIRCSFGSMRVYFDNALIQKGNATINLDVSFGGVELFIPKTWTVINTADFTFGSMDEKNHNQSSGVPTLTLTGDANFAGVTIIYI